MKLFTFVFVAASLACPSVVHAQVETAESSAAESVPDRKEVLAAMRSAASSILISKDGADVQSLPKPSFVYDDTLRKWNDGSVWVWGDKGRPSALVTMFRNNPNSWLTEVTTFLDSDSSLAVRSAPRRPAHNLRESCKILPVPTKLKPHQSKKLRKSQLKLLARSMKAYQMWDNDGKTELQRYELRMSTPIHEYADADRGVLEGAVFLFNYGSNPELSMVLEATADGWQCAFGRQGWASAQVTFEGKSFYEHPKISSSNGDGRYMMMSVMAKTNSGD